MQGEELTLSHLTALSHNLHSANAMPHHNPPNIDVFVWYASRIVRAYACLRACVRMMRARVAESVPGRPLWNAGGGTPPRGTRA